MSKLPENYIEKVYAGWYGKVIGVRAGANIEGWTHDRIRRVYGVLDGYPVDYKKLFAADDDTNGPMFFIRALADYSCHDITPEQIGLTWLNYAPFEHGFYWWGGYGISTEHTAYLNLRNGIIAPRSGSIEQNGIVIAEQIGGQIFIDTWGLVAPGNPSLAAELAGKAASVGHDGNAIYGGQFVAACIAEAFVQTDIGRIIDTGLSYIPPDCEYHKMADDVISFWRENPEDWELCFRFVFENYGYDRYPGHCHIIPNSAAMILSMLYGNGSFDDTINICNMCGWDTDCNVANVGTILGVMLGLDGIDYKKWRKPVNDFIAYSSVMGGLNLSDMPASAQYIANIGYNIAGEQLPDEWAEILAGKGVRCHFKLPDSTHAFLCSHHEYVLSNQSVDGRPALRLGASSFSGVEPLRVFKRTYVRPEDFHDSRYDPSFSPIIYPGYHVSCDVMLPKDAESELLACLYVLDSNTGKIYDSQRVKLEKGSWSSLSFDIPAMDNACISQVGVKFDTISRHNPKRNAIDAYIADFCFEGKAMYGVDFAHERMEDWGGAHREISQFSYLKGLWDIENGELSGSCADFGEAYTGGCDWSDYTYSVEITPQIGYNHMVLFRVQGAIRSYAAALTKNGLALLKNDNGYKVLAERDFLWEHGKTYKIAVKVRGDNIAIACNGSAMECRDRDKPYLCGAVGVGISEGSHCHFNHISIS